MALSQKMRRLTCVPLLLAAAGLVPPAEAQDAAVAEYFRWDPEAPPPEIDCRGEAEGDEPRHARAATVCGDLVVDGKLRAAMRQHRAGDLVAALDAYDASIEALRAEGDARDPRLIAPLQGRGMALRALDRHVEASEALAAAMHLQRIADGLHAPGTLALQPHLLHSFVMAGRVDAAAQRLQAGVATVAQAYGSDSQPYVAALEAASDYLQRLGRHEQALEMRKDWLARLEQLHGRDAPELAPALRAVAESERLIGQPELGTVDALSRLAGRMARDAPEAVQEAQEAIATMIALGDYYFAFGDTFRARGAYGRAGKALAAAPASMLASQLAEPAPLTALPRVLGGAGNAGQRLRAVRAQLRFSVDTRGRVHELTIESVAPGIPEALQERLRRSVLGARFRPRIGEKGVESVEAHRWEYRFLAPAATVAAPESS